jgi:pilus assembly protein CpaF
MPSAQFPGGAEMMRIDEKLQRISGIQFALSQAGGRPKSISVTTFPAVIGRDDLAQISLGGLWVGKQHSEIRLSTGGLMIVDKGTLAGTVVNGNRINEYGPIRQGDLIQIGSWDLRVEHIAQCSFAADDNQQGQILLQEAVDKLRALIDLRKKDWHGVSDQIVRSECRELLKPVVGSLLPNAESIQRDAFSEKVLAEAVGLGPLEELFQDPEISEVMVNAHDQIFVERHGVCSQIEARFSSEESVRAVIDRIVSPLGRRIDEASPMVDARLADGSRVNAVIPPLAMKGSSITIRRFMRRLMNPEDFVANGSASGPMLAFLEMAVKNRLNIVVSGGTGSGKTTLLNLLSRWIPSHERLITIEDAAELQLAHANLVSLEVRHANSEGSGLVSVRDLLRNSLRMRPDRIIVGECRGGETLDMLQAMNTGHEGSLTTIHANSPRDALSRLEVMVLMAGFELPLTAIREQVSSAIDVLIQQQRCSDGKRRIVSIAEVTGVESGVIQTQEIFAWRSDLSRHQYSGIFPESLERIAQQNAGIDFSFLQMHEEGVR